MAASIGSNISHSSSRYPRMKISFHTMHSKNSQRGSIKTFSMKQLSRELLMLRGWRFWKLKARLRIEKLHLVKIFRSTSIAHNLDSVTLETADYNSRSETLHFTREGQSSEVQDGYEKQNVLHGISFPSMTEGERILAQKEAANTTDYRPLTSSYQDLSYPDSIIAGQTREINQLSSETPNKTSQAQSKNDADELSRTAGQLLDNLKHEQSQKFQQSNFLALMRQLRDKEVRVEGDKMVDVRTSPFYPHLV